MCLNNVACQFRPVVAYTCSGGQVSSIALRTSRSFAAEIRRSGVPVWRPVQTSEISSSQAIWGSICSTPTSRSQRLTTSTLAASLMASCHGNKAERVTFSSSTWSPSTSTDRNLRVIRLRKKSAQLPTDPTPILQTSPSSTWGFTGGASEVGMPGRQRYVSTEAGSTAKTSGRSCMCAAASITANAAPKGFGSPGCSNGDAAVPRYAPQPLPCMTSPSPSGPITSRRSSLPAGRCSYLPYLCAS